MRTFGTHLLVPIFIAGITAIGALYGVWADMPQPRKIEQLFLNPASIGVCILAILAAFQAVLSYYEKAQEGRRVTYSFRLRRLPEPPVHVESKYRKPESVSGLLTVRVDRGGHTHHLLQRQIGYAEILSGPSELLYIEDVESRFSSVTDFRGSLVRIIFEPTESSFWTRDLYNKDDIADDLFDETRTAGGEHQVLVYTHTLHSRVSEYLSHFSSPDKVVRTQRMDLTVQNERALPNILSLATQISLYVNRERLFEMPVDSLRFYHHYAIGAKLSADGIERFSLFYAAEVAIEIDRHGIPRPADWTQDHSDVVDAIMAGAQANDIESGTALAELILRNRPPKGRDL